MQNVITVKCKYLGEEEYITKDGNKRVKHKVQDHSGRVLNMFKEFSGTVGEYYPFNIVLGSKWIEDAKCYDQYWSISPFHPDNLENN